jgi:hypothetical protein
MEGRGPGYSCLAAGESRVHEVAVTKRIPTLNIEESYLFSGHMPLPVNWRQQACVTSLRLPARLTVTGFTEHILAGPQVLPEASWLINGQEDFSMMNLRRKQYFGYNFGYRRQFALNSDDYAKLHVRLGLAGSPITLSYTYLS